MTRADLLSYLQERYTALATAAGRDTADDATGLKPAIDDTLRALGTVQTDLATAVIDQTQWDDALALGRYYLLRLIAADLATAIDLAFDAPAISKKRSQLFAQVQVLLDQATTDIAQRGYGPQEIALGYLNLDWIEPAGAEMG